MISPDPIGNQGISPDNSYKAESGKVPIEEDSDLGEECFEIEEGLEPWVAKHGSRPSEDEVEKHRAACHIPYRNWCPECNMGRGKEDFHKKRDAEREREKSH